MTPASPIQRGRGGFTLVELLVVIAILAALSSALILGVPAMLRSGDEVAMKAVLSQMAAALEAYGNNPRNGDFPPTLLDNDEFPGVGPQRNRENCGIESFVLCLNRKGMAGNFDFEGMEGVRLENYDQDRTAVGLTEWGPDNKELFELVDRWDTPIVYFHHRDYAIIEKNGLGRVSGVDGTVTAKPWKNPTTRTWYQPTGFQIISAGADGEFNTEDDITNFERN